jgi:peptide chain release factor 2
LENLQEVRNEITDIQAKLLVAKEKVDLGKLSEECAVLKVKMEDVDFWNDAEEAATVSQRCKILELKIEEWQTIFNELEEAIVLLESMSEEDFEFMKSDILTVLKKSKSLYLDTLLSGKYDAAPAILTVVCGTGGKDAQDFTEMLARMYLKYAEKQGFSVKILSETKAEDVGLKNMSILINGLNAFGYLKCEHGVHRLVRLSEFNSGNTRETSFAMVDVIPEISLNDEVEIKSEDLRIDLFRASGAGGQHVNTTDSAVRITHIPTGLVVSCQNDRSQHKNKEQALKILSGKLVQQLEEQNVAKVDSLRGVKTEMSWGNQIRSYVLHPYKMVKDHRTSYEVSNCDAVFDGDIQGFIEAKLVEN